MLLFSVTVAGFWDKVHNIKLKIKIKTGDPGLINLESPWPVQNGSMTPLFWVMPSFFRGHGDSRNPFLSWNVSGSDVLATGRGAGPVPGPGRPAARGGRGRGPRGGRGAAPRDRGHELRGSDAARVAAPRRARGGEQRKERGAVAFGFGSPGA